MNVRRFLADNMQDAMNRIKVELGPDAVILNSRNIRKKGIRGLISKPLVEVVAAYDKKEEPSQEKEKSRPKYVNRDDDKIAGLEKKLNDMNGMIARLVNNFNKKPAASRDKFNDNVNYLLDSLIENDVNEELAMKIAGEVQQIVNRQKANEEEVMAHILSQYFSEPKPITLKKFKQSVILFAGPTGVGKTTTVAKLAALFSIQMGAKVALITSDTYRIAAVDQLKTYAEILNVPVDVVYSPENLEDILKKHEDKDIIFIDTAGKSPNDETQEKEITGLLEKSGAGEVFLVLSATTGYKGCQHILNSYGFLKNYNLIITKTDEVPSPGMLLNVAHLSGRPISYVSTGQNVPEDIETAQPGKIINSLIGKEVL